MAHSLKQGILGRANDISLRFLPGVSRHRSAATRHSTWCGTWIRMQRGGCKPFSGRCGRGQDTDLRILSDGEDGLRGVVGTWFGKKCQHRLDWFHVVRRIGRIEKEFLYLPYGAISRNASRLI